MPTLTGVDVTLLVLILTLGAAAAARHVSTPTPVVLAGAGIGVGFLWHLAPVVPPVRVPPEHVLLIFLPPLLTSAAYALPLGAFRRALGPIALLAVGLVLTTMGVAAAVAHYAGSLPWAAALVLGAIVAPPDPVAATTVVGSLGLRHRLAVILEGEGLVNDAVAIALFHLSVSAATGAGVSVSDVLLGVAFEAPVGIVIGIAAGWVVTFMRRRLDDVTIEAGISVVAPYATYALADRVGASAVLAVVSLGFMLQRRESVIASPAVRLAVQTVWEAIEFASTSLVFFLLGILIGESVAGVSLNLRVVGVSAAVTAAVILLRLAWMDAVPPLIWRVVGSHSRHHESRRERVVMGWAGMRGVVSLALALSLPSFPEAASGYPLRSIMILITFAVIVGTLLVQGSTLGLLIGRLGLADPGRDARDEQRIRRRALRASSVAIRRAARGGGISPSTCGTLDEWLRNGMLGVANAARLPGSMEVHDDVDLILAAQREVIHHARQAGELSNAVVRRLTTELDVDAARAHSVEAGG